MSSDEFTPVSPTLYDWFVASLKIGLFSFGGGLAAWMLREFVVKRRWMTEDQFLSDQSIARVFPGTNVSNFLVLAGYRILGFPGALVGLVGILAGPFVIILAMAGLYEHFHSPMLEHALEGAGAAALGLMAYILVKSLKHMGKRWSALLILSFVCGAVLAFHVPLLLVVVMSLPLSFLVHKIDGGTDARR